MSDYFECSKYHDSCLMTMASKSNNKIYFTLKGSIQPKLRYALKTYIIVHCLNQIIFKYKDLIKK